MAKSRSYIKYHEKALNSKEFYKIYGIFLDT